MRVLILTFGTRGDVQPYVALARGLADAGHDVAVCTAEGFRDLIVGAGVRYQHMANDMLELIQTQMPTMAGPRDAVRMIGQMNDAMRASLLDQWEAAQRFGPDLIVHHPKTLGGLHIAERLDVPAVVSLPLPFLTPTSAFPIPFIARWPFAGRMNRLTYHLNRFTAIAYGGMINAFRRTTLGLPSMSRWTDYLSGTDGRPVPVLYGFSPAVVPIPPDYPRHAHVTGYWFHDEPATWRPPADLLAFLAAGPPPVYIGFGSMGFGRVAVERGRMVVDAVTAAGVRAVIATGWGGLELDTRDDSVHVIDDVPHHWLFPRTAAVVHHGGAGTTAAGLRAGRPSLICPVLGDQGFWGERVAALGAGPPPLPARRLTATALASRLSELIGTDRYRRCADQVAVRLRAEHGVREAVGVLERIAATR